MKLHLTTTAAILTLAAWPAAAQPAAPAPNSALETLGAMHQTGSTADWPEVPQTGQKADQVKQNLTKIKLPTGFHISLYALVPDARHIAVGPQGVATFVGTRKSKVWVVTDRSRGGVGDEVKEFAPTLPKKIPNGVCFSKDGFLYIAEQNRVLEYRGSRVLLRKPRRGRGRRRSGRGADSEIGGELQPHRAGLPGRSGQQALYSAGPTLQRAGQGQVRPLSQGRHGRYHPDGPRRQEPRGLRGGFAQPGRHGLQPEGQVALEQRQPGRRHGRRAAARAK